MYDLHNKLLEYLSAGVPNDTIYNNVDFNILRFKLFNSILKNKYKYWLEYKTNDLVDMMNIELYGTNHPEDDEVTVEPLDINVLLYDYSDFMFDKYQRPMQTAWYSSDKEEEVLSDFLEDLVKRLNEKIC